MKDLFQEWLLADRLECNGEAAEAVQRKHAEFELMLRERLEPEDVLPRGALLLWPEL